MLNKEHPVYLETVTFRNIMKFTALQVAYLFMGVGGYLGGGNRHRVSVPYCSGHPCTAVPHAEILRQVDSQPVGHCGVRARSFCTILGMLLLVLLVFLPLSTRNFIQPVSRTYVDNKAACPLHFPIHNVILPGSLLLLLQAQCSTC